MLRTILLILYTTFSIPVMFLLAFMGDFANIANWFWYLLSMPIVIVAIVVGTSRHEHRNILFKHLFLSLLIIGAVVGLAFFIVVFALRDLNL